MAVTQADLRIRAPLLANNHFTLIFRDSKCLFMDRIYVLSADLVSNTARPNLVRLELVSGDLEFLTKGWMAPAVIRLLVVV